MGNSDSKNGLKDTALNLRAGVGVGWGGGVRAAHFLPNKSPVSINHWESLASSGLRTTCGAVICLGSPLQVKPTEEDRNSIHILLVSRCSLPYIVVLKKMGHRSSLREGLTKLQGM